MIATASRLLMLASDERGAIRVGTEALAMAEELGLDEVKAAALVNIGSARAALGDEEGVAEIARGIDVARSANAAFDLCRGTGNLAARLWAKGRLAEARELWIQAEQASEQYGQRGFQRWFRGVLTNPEYELGDWDAAVARAEAFLAPVEAGAPHYLATQVYFCRALIRLGRGDSDSAVADVERGLELAQRAKDPQALYPACAMAAHVFVEIGDRQRALPPAEQFLAGLEGSPDIGFADVYLGVLSWTLSALGRGAESAAALEPYSRFPWARIGIAFGRGDPAGAAELGAEIGAKASEAFCRLAAARAGDLGQLEQALAFYRSVGAARYVREGESLIAASA